MPNGICRSMGPVVSMAVLMPPVPASAQEAVGSGPAKVQIVAEVAGSFVIRDAREAPPPTVPVRLGKTIRLDRALLGRPRLTKAHANAKDIKGGIHETR
jgi:hypothetical protein